MNPATGWALRILLPLSLIAACLDSASVTICVGIWLLYLLLDFMLQPKTRAITAITGFLTLYSTSAYLVSQLGLLFFGVDAATIECITRKTLAAIITSYPLLLVSAEVFKFPELSETAARFKKRISAIPVSRIHFLLLLFFLIGFYLWYQIFVEIGITRILDNPRQYSSKLFALNNQYFQMIIIPFTIILVARASCEREKITKAILLSASAWLWLPTAVMGARRELFLLSIAFTLFLELPKKRLFFTALLAASFFLGLPLVREGWAGFENLILSIQEFVLPQYTHFICQSVLSRTEVNHLITTSGYGTGIWALVPSFLRLQDFQGFGSAFFRFSATNVGIGAHPIGEAVINMGEIGYFFFVPLLLALVNTVFLAGKKYPEILILGVPYLVIFGRSDLWITVYFMLYSSTLFILATNSYEL